MFQSLSSTKLQKISFIERKQSMLFFKHRTFQHILNILYIICLPKLQIKNTLSYHIKLWMKQRSNCVNLPLRREASLERRIIYSSRSLGLPNRRLFVNTQSGLKNKTTSCILYKNINILDTYQNVYINVQKLFYKPYLQIWQDAGKRYKYILKWIKKNDRFYTFEMCLMLSESAFELYWVRT